MQLVSVAEKNLGHPLSMIFRHLRVSYLHPQCGTRVQLAGRLAMKPVEFASKYFFTENHCFGKLG